MGGPGRNRTAISAMRMQCSTVKLRAHVLVLNRVRYSPEIRRKQIS